MANATRRRLITVAWLLVAPLLAGGCSNLDQLVTEIFNEDRFLSDVGAATGAANQVTPDTAKLILLRLTNLTENRVSIKIRVNRQSGIERLDWGTISGNSTVGQLIENCDTDQPAMIRLAVLGEDQGVPVNQTIIYPDAFVWVNNNPIIISAGPPPLEFNVHYVCGNTIEYIVRRVAGETQKYEIVVRVFQ